jgi:hypothetical protein
LNISYARMYNLAMAAQENREIHRLGCEPVSIKDLQDDFLLTRKPNYADRLGSYGVLHLNQPRGQHRFHRPPNVNLDVKDAVGICSDAPGVELLPRNFLAHEGDHTAIAVAAYTFGLAVTPGDREDMGRTLDIQQFQTANFPPKSNGNFSFERALGFFDYKAALIRYLEQFAYWLVDNQLMDVDYVSVQVEGYKHRERVDRIASEMAAKERRDHRFTDFEKVDNAIKLEKLRWLRSLGYNSPAIVYTKYARASAAKAVIDINPIPEVQRSFALASSY